MSDGFFMSTETTRFISPEAQLKDIIAFLLVLAIGVLIGGITVWLVKR